MSSGGRRRPRQRSRQASLPTIGFTTLESLAADLLTALRRRHPGARICGGGFGWRRRRIDGVPTLHDERVLRVFVPAKVDRRRAAKNGTRHDWLPCRIRVVGPKFRITIPIDVDELPVAVPTWFPIGTPADTIQSAAALATWRRWDGQRGQGVVTAGHGFWQPNGSGGHDLTPEAKVQLADGTVVTGRIRAASLLRTDGVDVALVEVPESDVTAHAWRSAPAGWPDTRLPAAGLYAQLLGGLGDELALAAGFRGATRGSDRCRAVAWYPEVTAAVADFGTVRLRGVIETQAEGGVFLPGTSGSPIGALGARALPLGIQSLCLDPGSWTRSYATDFVAAATWLQSRVGPTLRLHWQTA